MGLYICRIKGAIKLRIKRLSGSSWGGNCVLNYGAESKCVKVGTEFGASFRRNFASIPAGCVYLQAEMTCLMIFLFSHPPNEGDYERLVGIINRTIK